MSNKILVVDDAKVVRVSLGKIMKKLGFEIFEAEDGAVALEQMKSHPDIAIIMLDWNMPVMNGYDFLVALRAQPKHATLPYVVMVTTETGMPSMLKALAGGANEYIMKPFSESIIRDKLEILGIEEPR